MIEPPYRNPTLANLPGEKWKDVPDFEGTYKISNYGRIKSFSREVVNSMGIYKTHDVMLKPTVVKYPPRGKKLIYGSPTITLAKDGINYSFTIARLVYTLYIEKINYYDRSWVATLKDKTRNDVHVSNIIKSTIGKLQIEAHRRLRGKGYVSAFEGPGGMANGR